MRCDYIIHANPFQCWWEIADYLEATRVSRPASDPIPDLPITPVAKRWCFVFQLFHPQARRSAHVSRQILPETFETRNTTTIGQRAPVARDHEPGYNKRAEARTV